MPGALAETRFFIVFGRECPNDMGTGNVLGVEADDFVGFFHLIKVDGAQAVGKPADRPEPERQRRECHHGKRGRRV